MHSGIDLLSFFSHVLHSNSIYFTDTMAIKRALLSVSDKTGLIEFASSLHTFGVELLSTGGTAKALREADLPVIDVSDYTQAPELFEGRVKTLHPKVHGGLLQRRDSEEHQAQAKEHQIPTIDLVVVNLYPFESTVAKEGVTLAEAIENIDIGGPSMLRSAAKNYASVTVVTDAEDYGKVLEEMEKNQGDTTVDFRMDLAKKVFLRTSTYDNAIQQFLHGTDADEKEQNFSLELPFAQKLSYGENRHQEATLYGTFDQCFTQLQGKQLSYNNIVDIESAADLILDFIRPTVAILKHNNPCGVGQDDECLKKAWDRAFSTDRQAPFGGIVVCNRPVTELFASILKGIFTEVIIAPDFEPEALEMLQKKKNLRLMKINTETYKIAKKEPFLRSAPGGLLVMDKDHTCLGIDDLESCVQTKTPPTQEQIRALRFAQRVVKHVKSNAIVYATSNQTLGIGAGQMSRVDSAKIGAWKAIEAGLESELKTSVIASDAFFPFADGLQVAIQAGVKACIQPGGSKNDAEVIAAADEAGIAMVFTGNRHFRH